LAFFSAKTACNGDGVIALLEDEPARDETSSPLVVFRTVLAAVSGNVFLGNAVDDRAFLLLTSYFLLLTSDFPFFLPPLISLDCLSLLLFRFSFPPVLFLLQGSLEGKVCSRGEGVLSVVVGFIPTRAAQTTTKDLWSARLSPQAEAEVQSAMAG